MQASLSMIGENFPWQGPTMDSAGTRIKTLRKRAGLSQARLAELVADATGDTVSRGAVGNWELNGGISTTNLTAIARILNSTVEFIHSGREESAPSPQPPSTERSDTHRPLPRGPVSEVVLGPDVALGDFGARDIPVLGTAMGGTDDDERPVDFWLTGEIENYVARPKGLASAKNLFSMYIGGDSMEPRFEARDMVFVQKAMPAIGDDVVIELHPRIEGGDHPTLIKRLVRRNGSFITVKQYNPPKELEFNLSEIKNLFRVIPLKELI